MPRMALVGGTAGISIFLHKVPSTHNRQWSRSLRYTLTQNCHPEVYPNASIMYIENIDIRLNHSKHSTPSKALIALVPWLSKVPTILSHSFLNFSSAFSAL